MRQLVLRAGLAVVLTATASPAAAQWVPIECELNTGHYLVNSAVLYLRNAGRTRFADQRERDMRDARRVLTQALDQGRDDDPAIWYLMGRLDAAANDLVGADSAWDKAEAGAPQCREDLQGHRRRLWVPILNRGVDALRNTDYDVAKSEFHRANRIYDAEPPGFYYLAQAYQNTRQSDSAVAYYEIAMEIASRETNRDDEQYTDIPEQAAYNVAVLYNIEQKYDSSVAWFARYRALKPDDYQAMTAQATALSMANREAEAIALYDSVLIRADEMPALQLFETGAALFRANRFERAAQAFEAGLERNPHYRDALYNLANTYFRLSELDSGLTEEAADARKAEIGLKMQPVAEQLVSADPASAAAMRLLAAAYLLRGVEDSTVATLERAERLTFDVTVSVFRPASGGGLEVRGLITNQAEGETTVPTITFEFLNDAGEVLESADVPGQAIEAGGGLPFAMRPTAEGISAWRYTFGS